ncbi:GtrA family protein [Novosphingobium rosa]|uniref:GtrA family protein n=1 Tax=Novosphingobium rosa TaxID=76978 RepID=UPI0008346025|nr:GtrA family protein [Novosphingobium rosa]
MKLYAAARRLTHFEPMRYLGVGAVVTVLNNIVLIGGDRAGLGYGPLMALSWFVGGTAGYLLHARHTFRRAHGWGAYARFMAGVALGVPLALAMLAGLKSGLGLPMWVAAPTATVGMLAYNYLSARLAIVWRAWLGRSA